MDLPRSWLITGAVVALSIVYFSLWKRFTSKIEAKEFESTLDLLTDDEAENDLPSRKFTANELREYDGSDKTLPVYVAVKGWVFDVSTQRDMFSPGQSYAVFAGRDGSRALGMASVNLVDAVADCSTLTAIQQKVLDNWYAFFAKCYPIVGRIEDSDATTSLVTGQTNAVVPTSLLSN